MRSMTSVRLLYTFKKRLSPMIIPPYTHRSHLVGFIRPMNAIYNIVDGYGINNRSSKLDLFNNKFDIDKNNANPILILLL